MCKLTQFIRFRIGKNMNYTTETFQCASELNVFNAKLRCTLNLKPEGLGG